MSEHGKKLMVSVRKLRAREQAIAKFAEELREQAEKETKESQPSRES